MQFCWLVPHKSSLYLTVTDAVEDRVKSSDPSNGSVVNGDPNKADSGEEEGVKQAFLALPSENTSSPQKSSILQVFKKVPLYYSIRNSLSLWFVLEVITVSSSSSSSLSVSRFGLWRSVWRLCSRLLCQFFPRLRWMWKRCMEGNGVRNTHMFLYLQCNYNDCQFINKPEIKPSFNYV